MQKNIPLIENMPFFISFHSKNKAVIDIEVFEKWIADADFLTGEDKQHRDLAFEELKKAKALNVSEAMP